MAEALAAVAAKAGVAAKALAAKAAVAGRPRQKKSTAVVVV